MNDHDMKRECTALADRYLKKDRRQLPGLCYWVIIARHFQQDQGAAQHYAMEELRYCKYLGSGGIPSLKTFLSKFKLALNNVSEAGGTVDDSNFLVKDMFANEFRRIPELKDSTQIIDRSPICRSCSDAKRYTLTSRSSGFARTPSRPRWQTMPSQPARSPNLRPSQSATRILRIWGLAR